MLDGAFHVALVVKNLPANVGDIRHVSSIPGGGHGNALQFSCPENPMDRGSWWAMVHRVAESQIRLSDLTHMLTTLDIN